VEKLNPVLGTEALNSLKVWPILNWLTRPTGKVSLSKPTLIGTVDIKNADVSYLPVTSILKIRHFPSVYEEGFC